MQAPCAGFAQTQVTIVCDFRYCKAGTIVCTGNHAPRSSAAFAQYQIAKLIAFPALQRFQDFISGEIFATWRGVEIDPTAERWFSESAIILCAYVDGKQKTQ